MISILKLTLTLMLVLMLKLVLMKVLLLVHNNRAIILSLREEYMNEKCLIL